MNRQNSFLRIDKSLVQIKKELSFTKLMEFILWTILAHVTTTTLLTEHVLAARPNVLMIVLDDMNDWAGCLHTRQDVQTPNIDRLAEKGMLFTNAHCAAPVCNASRVATLTGRQPGSTGIYDNGVRWHEAMPGIPSIPKHFKQNGYHVAGGGKIYHHMPGFNRLSDWDEYFAQTFDGHYQTQLHSGLDVSDFHFPPGFPLNNLPSVKALKKPPKNPREFDWGPLDKADLETGDGKMVKWAINFLENPPDEPFFLAAGIYRPHLPFYAPKEYFERYVEEALQKPPIKSDDLNDLPPTGLKFAAQRREDYELILREGKYKELLQAYLASISFADAMVGRLIDAVEQGHHADNTVIVLWSDHGWHFGEKRHLHKFTLWERSTRIPFIIVAPGITETNTTCDQPVGMIDLFPTLNALCSLPSVPSLDGQNIEPLLRNPEQRWERPALTTHGQGNHAVRSRRWRYIRYADGGEELYDHSHDPNEWTNLASKPEFIEVKNYHAQWLPKTDAVPVRKKK